MTSPHGVWGWGWDVTLGVIALADAVELAVWHGADKCRGGAVDGEQIAGARRRGAVALRGVGVLAAQGREHREGEGVGLCRHHCPFLTPLLQMPRRPAVWQRRQTAALAAAA